MKNISIPSLSNPLLAYEIGAHIGDGSLQIRTDKKEYSVTFWGSTEELSYYERVLKPTLEHIFGLRNLMVKRVSKENTVYLRIYCMKLVRFKQEVLGLPVGDKGKMTSLPEFLIDSDLLLRNCIKGLFDTDGCLSFLTKGKLRISNYPRISLEMKTRPLVEQVNGFLIQLGFSTTFYYKHQFDARTKKYYQKWCININGVDMLKKWIREIGFANLVHLTKYYVWERYGFCPAYSALSERVRMLHMDRCPYDPFSLDWGSAESLQSSNADFVWIKD